MAVNRQRPAGRPPKGEAGLDVPRIVEAAWALVDEAGIAGLSTRTLAAALNVKSPALYWHVRSKEELLGLMMEHLLLDTLVGVSSALNWKAWLKEVVRRQRRLLLSHRDSGLIASLAPPSEQLRTQVFDRMVAPLIDGGISPTVAGAAAGGMASFVLGWVIYEQRSETRAFMETYHDPDIAFELLLEAFVNGIAETAATPDNCARIGEHRK